MKPAAVEYLAARNVDEVFAALADGETSVLAGGQSLVPEVARADGASRRLVDINRVEGLDLLAEEDGVLRIGPLVRHRTFESDAVAGPLGDLLRVVVKHIGHPPIRARGTMLGSLAYAHPAGEWPAMVVMLGASMVLAGARGRRTVSADCFFADPFTTVRRPDELLIEARIPALRAGTGIGYAEDRRTTIFPQAAAMAAITVSGDGVITAAAVCLVNSGPYPVRACAAESALVGMKFCDATIAAAAEVAAEKDTDRLSAHASLPKQRQAYQTLARRALRNARDGAGRCE